MNTYRFAVSELRLSVGQAAGAPPIVDRNHINETNFEIWNVKLCRIQSADDLTCNEIDKALYRLINALQPTAIPTSFNDKSIDYLCVLLYFWRTIRRFSRKFVRRLRQIKREATFNSNLTDVHNLFIIVVNCSCMYIALCIMPSYAYSLGLTNTALQPWSMSVYSIVYDWCITIPWWQVTRHFGEICRLNDCNERISAIMTYKLQFTVYWTAELTIHTECLED